MIDRGFLGKLTERYRLRAKARREISASATEAQSAAKRAIFALHRDDAAGAKELLAAAEAALDKASLAAGKDAQLVDEGAFVAAREEYAEAALYRMYVETGKVAKLRRADIGDGEFLGGLADLAGELQRRQVKAATEGRKEDVAALKAAIEEIVTSLVEIDLTGYLRTKFDQAKNALRRAEEVHYELSLRR
jgi:predicted translin family RNA/ssDNA-binding protein